MATIIVEKKGLTNVRFESNAASKIIKNCNRQSRLDITKKQLKTLSDALERAIEWDLTFHNTTKKFNALRAIQKHIAAIIKQCEKIGLDNFVAPLKEFDEKIFLISSSTSMGKYLREYHARGLETSFEDYLIKMVNSPADRIQDSRHKLYTAFAKKAHHAFKGQSGLSIFLATFYKEYYAPVVLKKTLKSKSLQQIYRENVRPML